MGAGLWLAVGLVAEVVVLLIMLASVRRENRALAYLVETSADGDKMNEGISALPYPQRSIAAEFLEDVQKRSQLDDALAKAMVRAVRDPFGAPFLVRIAASLGLVLLCFAPAVAGLTAAAGSIAAVAQTSRSLERALVYIEGQSLLEAPFELLHGAFSVSAVLFVGLAGLGALSWWLRRPEVREARFVRALLESAAQLRPGTAAPVSARLSELIAPDRGLTRPIAASVLWLVAVTLAWLVLLETAGVRAANATEPVFDVWPTAAKKRRPFETSSDIILPAQRAGAPLDEVARPSLVIGPTGVRLKEVSVAEIENGRLAPGWKDSPTNLADHLRGFKKPLEVTLLGHNDMLMEAVLPVLWHLRDQYEAHRYHLIVERTVQLGAPGGRRLQADLPLEMGPASEAPALKISIEGDRITLPSGTVRFSDPSWQRALSDAVRALPELLGPQRKAVEIRTTSDLAYLRFVEVLASADTTCRGRADCGLPGLGLRFVLTR